MRPGTAALATSLALVFAAPASAQSLAEACETVGDVTIGQWAEYEATIPQMGNDPMTMRIAIVGTEEADGVEHFWHELQMAAPQGQMIMQMLVPRYPFDAGEIKGLVMKAGDQPAMRMPDQMIGMMLQRMGDAGGFASEAAKNCEGAELVGTERVEVPAGAFEAMHLRSTKGDDTQVWVSLDVPFGIIKMEGADGQRMVLVGHGMDAESAITETPQTMPGG